MAVPGEAPHLETIESVAARLQSSATAGLEAEEARARLRRVGPNLILARARRSAVLIFLLQFSDFMVLVLAAAAVLAGIVGEPQDTVAIAAILLLNGVLGFVQEYRAERALELLRSTSVPAARVRRPSGIAVVPGTELVPGDLVMLEAGNLVPADLRLTHTTHLRIQEATLTGESQAVEKVSTPLDRPAGLADRRNMAYKGTAVVHGRGSGLVVATGMETELGRIAGMLAGETRARTPLQIRLTRLGRVLAGAALAICALVLLLGLLRGEPPLAMLLTAISLAVAAIPEALPAVVTVALALGARRMIRERALVRHLPAVETLGSVTCICSDKTGTLTQNRMQVEAYRIGELVPAPPGPGNLPEPWLRLLRALALNNDVVLSPAGSPAGDPTEIALFEAADRAGVDPLNIAQRHPRLAEIPFTSERARMTTVHRDGGGYMAYTKGSPERVIAACVDRQGAAGAGPLDRDAVLREADAMAETGLRVIAFACRRLQALPADHATLEHGQTLLGLVGLMDPPRPEAAAAVATCRASGIKVIMITGDHPITARSIARRLGILQGGGEMLTGAELETLSPEELRRRSESVQVYARVEPAQKIAIIRALQARGECVAMTGDGVNDAPALHRADIGIAMGQGGTDVAREAASMVLLDDNFATIVSAVRAGRRIYDNVRKFVRYAVTCNAAEIWTLLLAPLIGLPIPLLPIHLLWINLVTDGLPGVALALEPAELNVMRRPPRPPGESIFARGLWQHVIWVGVLMAGVTLATQAWAWHAGSGHWQTMTFTVLALSQMAHVLAIRSERESLFRIGIGTNPLLLGAVALTVLLQLGTIYLPGASAVFRTQPLTLGELAACLLLSLPVFLAVEAEKFLVRRGRLYGAGAQRSGALQSGASPA